MIFFFYYFNFVDFIDGEGYGEIRLNKEDLKEFFEIVYFIVKECCRFEFLFKVKEFLELKDEELKLKVLFDIYKRGICVYIKYIDGFVDFEVEKVGF